MKFKYLVKRGCHGVQIKAEDVNVFLRGGGALDINSVRKKPKARTTARLHIHCRWLLVWSFQRSFTMSTL